LRQEDLPELARAIVAVIRKRATIGTNRSRGVDYVTIRQPGTELNVLGSDWALILPYIQEGAFSPMLRPVDSGAKFLHPEVFHNDSVIDLGDKPLYFHVLAYLRVTFTETYPTSDL
jgi:hypothetical protein